ncbi:mitogen-activated protein kinase kinase kinase 18-like [Cornus florida]|uniref:mitogen-activated protein kinase kinase kinase 18-like n=1 Tax=Cornus florida TaxID=4283 RepID=UPI00289CC77C|nr:mitogen-activated protein kinase kinase kinase 18-like [Cornus florida]
MEKVNRNSNWVRGACIGRGSFGTVSLAVDKSDGHVFAVKSVDQSLCLSSQLEALENEIQILRSLSSPYVVEYVGDDVTTSFRNLYLEYLPGGTVADLAKCSGAADADEGIIRSYTWCVVSALRYVHSKGLVHCDVKGKNVLVGSTPGMAKLADFGSAIDSTAAITPRGSPLWMAPEVIRREHQGPESDVWSLGCTVIEMITGKPAWEDRGADTLCRIGYSDQLPELPTQLSELGRDFLDKCLRRDHTKRWSCDQLLRHPFMSSSSPSDSITHSSPRCVLDWFNSELSDEDNEEITQSTNSKLQFHENSARERMGELATNAGANWESDGWLVVRNLISEREEVSDACCSGGVQERTSSEYPELISTDEEISRINSEYYNNYIVVEQEIERTNWEYADFGGGGSDESNMGGWGGVEAGSSCPYGSQERDWTVDKCPKDFTTVVLVLSLFLLYVTVTLCILILLYTLFTFYIRLQTLHVTIQCLLVKWYGGMKIAHLAVVLVLEGSGGGNGGRRQQWCWRKAAVVLAEGSGSSMVVVVERNRGVCDGSGSQWK